MHKIFVKPANIKYSNIHFLATILRELSRYHQDFCISVVDDLLERIVLGLELNDFKFNQRRIAEIRYLGELYVYRVVESNIIFDTLFKILSYGHGRTFLCGKDILLTRMTGDWPRPDVVCELDRPDDFFRIRLVCILLEICGPYYDKGATKKKLDFLLTFLQVFITHTSADTVANSNSTTSAQNCQCLWTWSSWSKIPTPFCARNGH